MNSTRNSQGKAKGRESKAISGPWLRGLRELMRTLSGQKAAMPILTFK